MAETLSLVALDIGSNTRWAFCTAQNEIVSSTASI